MHVVKPATLVEKNRDNDAQRERTHGGVGLQDTTAHTAEKPGRTGTNAGSQSLRLNLRCSKYKHSTLRGRLNPCLHV
jgi:hypothetical protein